MSDDIVESLRVAAEHVSKKLGPEYLPLAMTLCEGASAIEVLRQSMIDQAVKRAALPPGRGKQS